MWFFKTCPFTLETIGTIGIERRYGIHCMTRRLLLIFGVFFICLVVIIEPACSGLFFSYTPHRLSSVEECEGSYKKIFSLPTAYIIIFLSTFLSEWPSALLSRGKA